MMKQSRVVLTLLTLGMSLSGCAGSPVALGNETSEQLAKESNYNLCRAAFSRHATKAIENEVKNRQIDCVPYVQEAARRKGQADASVNAYVQSLNRNQPVTTNCTTYGNNVNCQSY